MKNKPDIYSLMEKKYQEEKSLSYNERGVEEIPSWDFKDDDTKSEEIEKSEGWEKWL